MLNKLESIVHCVSIYSSENAQQSLQEAADRIKFIRLLLSQSSPPLCVAGIILPEPETSVSFIAPFYPAILSNTQQ